MLSYYVYNFTNEINLRSLARGAQTIVSSIDSQETTALKVSEEDLENPAYISIKSKLQRIQSVGSGASGTGLGLYFAQKIIELHAENFG